MEKQAPDGWKFNKNKIRYVLIEALCLVIVGEIISLLAGGTFSWDITIATAVEVVLLAILAFISVKNPYAAIMSALVIFVLISILSAALKPVYLGGSIIIKIFILIYLVRAIPDARELQATRRKDAADN
ncbi:MAG: hypothetical protein JST63_02780 [Bacteroidetes bacterium]|nr:hypothetical protein [Bacteroidota bacterium]